MADQLIEEQIAECKDPRVELKKVRKDLKFLQTVFPRRVVVDNVLLGKVKVT